MRSVTADRGPCGQVRHNGSPTPALGPEGPSVHLDVVAAASSRLEAAGDLGALPRGFPQVPQTVYHQDAVPDSMILEKELQLYEESFDEYREKYPGRHLLFCNGKFQGDYATREEAVTAGYRLAAKEMLVRESGQRTPTRIMPSLLRA